MLDIHLLRENKNCIVDILRDREVEIWSNIGPEETVQKLIDLDNQYLNLLNKQNELRQKINENTNLIKTNLEKNQSEVAKKLIEEGRQLRKQEKQIDNNVKNALNVRDDAWNRVPNKIHPQSPRNNDYELRRVGKIRNFVSEGFEPRDHLTVAESLKLVDFDTASKVTGPKFYYLKNDCVLLDLALQHFALKIATNHGFTLHITPDLARENILQGLGFNPRGDSTQIYKIANSDLCLVGTAEITLGGMLANTILVEEQLPLLFCGLSHCFRTEAGSAGKESHGLYRVHQFTKVELFAFTTREQSEEIHSRFLAIEEEIFSALEIPYRVLDVSSRDLGNPAYRKFDLEAWMPGRNTYGEITSTSNCTDYQARRLQIRYRSNKNNKMCYVHMVNGTAIATSRALVAIFENYQQKDGSLHVPKKLQPFVGKTIIH